MTATPPERVIALLRAGAAPSGQDPASAPPPLSAQEWQALVPVARAHGVTGLLYRAIHTLGRTDVPETVRTVLHQTYQSTQVHQLVALHELAGLAGAFAEAQVDLIVLKGGALAPTLYPDPALRPFGDLDLLVRAQETARAGDLLLARGYEPVLEMSEGMDGTLWGQQTFLRRGNNPARVELHSHLFVHAFYRDRVQLDWFREQRSPFEIEQQTAYLFAPPAQLLHLAAHAALHHRDLRLIWLYDIALLLARYGETLDWEKLTEIACSFGLARPLQHALEETASVWGMVLPAPVREFMARPVQNPSDRLMYALARSRHRQVRWLADGFGTGMGYWRAHLLPSPRYMRARYGIAHSVQLPFYYLGRLGVGGVKFLRAVAVLVGDTLKERRM